MNAIPALFVQGLNFAYRRSSRPALQGIELSVEQGAFAGIVGANGAGKSTLCCTFNRIVPAFHRGQFDGRVEVLGKDISSAHVAEMVAVVGMVFQDFETQILSTCLLHEVSFVMENLGLPRAHMLAKAAFWLEEMGLSSLTDQNPATLSGGQKQRLVLASVLAAEPPILVLDEPTTDLDPVSAHHLFEILEGLVHQGRTILLVTHDLDCLVAADSVFTMSRGSIANSGSPKQLLTDLEGLKRLGMRPPQLAGVFCALGHPEFPATPEIAATRLTELGIRVRRQNPSKSPPAPGREILSVASLRFGYGSYEVIHGIDLVIKQGEFVALLGRNGSGKTTLLNLIAGLLKPRSGTVLVNGRSVHDMSPPARAAQLGIVFQNPDHQIFQPTCLDEVEFGLRHMGVVGQASKVRALEALASVKLAEKAAMDPFTMAKGDRKKLALAAVLACQPQLILLDEPTTGLDAVEQDVMMEVLSLLVSQGHTVFFVTHAIALAARYAHRTIIMDDGDILVDGPPSEALLDETRLFKAGLRTPPAMKLGRILGVSVCTPEELTALLYRGEPR